MFEKGTVIQAQTFYEAMVKLDRAQTAYFWAVECEKNTWDVQFEDDVTVEGVQALDSVSAARCARHFIERDSKDSTLVSTPRLGH